MKNRRKRIGLPIIIATVLTALMFVAFAVLYGVTRYAPLLMLGLMCLMPSLVNITVMLTSLRLPEGEAPTRPERVADPADAFAEPDGTDDVRAEGEDTRGSKKGKKAKKRKKYAKKPSLGGIVFTAKRIWHGFAGFYNRRREVLAGIISFALIVLSQVAFFISVRRITSVYTVSYASLVVLLFVFIAFITLDKVCAHTVTELEFIGAIKKNIRSVLILLRTVLVLLMAAMLLKLLGIYDAQTLLKYIMIAVWIYISVFTVICLAVALIKKELFATPRLNIPAPFSIGARDFGVISYLEENTGITMRSLWSIKVIRTVVPYTAAAIVLIFWLSTGLVQVEAYQAGAVYRFGKLSDELLEPGLHICLPWPIDKVEIYDTESVQQFSVGYISTENVDNTWTGEHGLSEYRLLLGSGDELVSVNLRVEYKISDLYRYLKNNSDPKQLLEAEAYHLVTDKTINTDLETLLSTDRSAFSTDFKEELTERVSVYDMGLEVVSVVLESIHPPIEVAEVYQSVISAQLEAQQMLLEAQAYAATTKAGAELSSYKTLSSAKIDNITSIAEAKASVAEFMASVSADNENSSSYRYYKYLEAIKKAYGDARLIIVGEGIDSSNIYFGSLYSSGNGTE